MTRTIEVSQAQGWFTASKTGSIQFNNLLNERITSRLYLNLVDYNDENQISLLSRLDVMSPNSNNTEQISGEVTWYGTQTFTTNRLNLIISSGKQESIDITLNGQTLVKGTFTASQEVRFFNYNNLSRRYITSIRDGAVFIKERGADEAPLFCRL